MKCQSCGADNPPEAKTCGYCHSQLLEVASPSRKAVFVRIKESDTYARRDSHERHARLPKYGATQKAIMMGFFVVFIGFSAVMCIVALGMAGVFGFIGFRGGRGAGAMGFIPLFFAIMPLGFVALGIFLLVKMRRKMESIEKGPVQADAVLVVDKRTQVGGGSGDHSASTHYFVTCEREDGSRQEYQVWDGNMYGRMTAGDAGVLFVRSGYGLDFDRVTA